MGLGGFNSFFAPINASILASIAALINSASDTLISDGKPHHAIALPGKALAVFLLCNAIIGLTELAAGVFSKGLAATKPRACHCSKTQTLFRPVALACIMATSA